MSDQSDNLNYCFFFVVISNLYLFQEIVLLNHSLLSMINQILFQFINGKSRNLQKLLRYLSGIVTAGCGGHGG